jgi:indolepyruvate ferredoxin oxidoreductase beta subunit
MTKTSTYPQPLSLLIGALGGEGGGVLSEWLTAIARHAGYAAQSTSIPGVAQRTGATTYFFEMYPMPVAQLGGRQPVFSLNPIPGRLDALVSSELLETARTVSNGLPSPERTLIITSSSRTLTNTERMHLGDGRLDDTALIAIMQSACRAHHLLDMQRIARENGTVVSAVMLGAIAGSGLLPFAKDDYIAIVRDSGRGAQASLAGFEAAWQRVHEGREQAAFAQQLVGDVVTTAVAKTVAKTVTGAALDSSPDVLNEFPSAAQDVLALGLARVIEYQDAAYGTLYLERMRRVKIAEVSAVTTASKSGDIPEEATHHTTDDVEDGAITREVARWLALWMAYDDIVRVADLKSRAARSQRVRSEARVAEGEVLKTYEYFKPGIPEIAALLPAPLADRLKDANRRRLAEGRPAWEVPVKLASHTILGTLLLRTLAAMKHLRRWSSRYAEEQALIEEWLGAVQVGAMQSRLLGFEIAQCGRLIKGYGSTNERGRDNLLHVIRHLAQPAFGSASERANAIRRARTAALADDAGKALDKALNELGAPPRAIKAQPIRWMPRNRITTGPAK